MIVAHYFALAFVRTILTVNSSLLYRAELTFASIGTVLITRAAIIAHADFGVGLLIR